MPEQSQYVFAVFHFSAHNVGWSEVYNLRALTVDPQVMDSVGELLDKRMLLFGSDVECLYARVSVSGKPRDAKLLQGFYPIQRSAYQSLTPLVFSGPVNDCFVGLQFRCEGTDETPRAFWATRLISGCPDALISAMKSTAPYPLHPEVPPLAVNRRPLNQITTGGTAWGNFWQAFLDQCAHVKLIQAGPPPIYRVSPFARVLFRRIGKRDRGRPFGLFRGRRAKSHL